MAIKDVLKNRRIELGLTMKETAAKVGVTEGTISRWESGDIENMRRDKIAAYSKVLRVDPAVIMGWNDPPKEDPLISKLNRLNEVGRAYIDTQIDYALTRPDFVSKKNNTDHEEGVREEGAVG